MKLPVALLVAAMALAPSSVGCTAPRTAGANAKPLPIVPTTQTTGRPSFAGLKQAYPLGTPEDVALLVGGKVKYNFDVDPLYKNTCAIRLSRAMNYGGAPIVRADVSATGGLCNSGSDKKWYIFRMADFAKYVTLKYGDPVVLPVDTPARALAGRRGIVAFGMLHIDLWDGEQACTANYFESEKVKDPIRFWELPE